MKRSLMCVVFGLLVLALVPVAGAEELNLGGECVTLQELLDMPQATEAATAIAIGRKKTDPVTVCDAGEPNGGGTSVTCQDYYKTTAHYACTTGTAKSPSCDVKGACNLPTGGTGTKCECTHWCVTSTEPTEPGQVDPL